MPLFLLEARTAEAKLVRQLTVAQTEAIAVRQLRGTGLHIVRVERVRPRRKHGPLGLGRTLEPREASLFLHQLGELLSAGISPAEAADDLATRARPQRLRLFLRESAPRLRAGTPLSLLLAERADLFEPHIAGAVAAAEQAGALDAVFEPLAEDYRESDRERRRLTFPLTYLKAVAVFAAIAATIPVAIGHGLVVWLQNTVLNGGPLLLAALVAFSLVRAVLRLPPVATLVSALLDRAPLLGRGRRVSYALRFLRAYGALVHAGALPQEALEAASPAVGPERLAARALRGADHVRAGGKLGDALRYTGLLGTREAGLLATGEEAGELDSTVTECLRLLEDDRDRESLRRTIWLWALLLLLTAAVVLLACVIGWRAIYAAIYDWADDLLLEE